MTTYIFLYDSHILLYDSHIFYVLYHIIPYFEAGNKPITYITIPLPLL